MKKSDIEFHSDRGWNQRPAINIKIYGYWEQVKLPIDIGYVDGVLYKTHWMFTHEWIEDNISETEFSNFWWDQANDSVRNIIWRAEEIYYPQKIKAYQEGRSGGWLVFDFHRDDVELWDAIDLMKWRRVCKAVKAEKEAFHEQLLMQIYNEKFLDWLDSYNKNSEKLVMAQG